MKEKYFTGIVGDDIIVTRKSDRKTIAFPRVDCLEITGKISPYKIAIALAKNSYEQGWE